MNQPKKRILVTGGAGFIGSHLIPRLLERDYSVLALDNMSSGKMENLSEINYNSSFKIDVDDIRNKKTLAKVSRGVFAIVHLAALVDVSASVADPLFTHDVNVTGTLNVLQEAVKNKVKKCIFASSAAVYGDMETLPAKEGNYPKPISPYAASKAAGESYCYAFSKCYGLNSVVLRFFNVYGLRNENSPYSGVISKFIRKVIRNDELIIEGDGEQTRDFIHVNDVVSAIISALEKSSLKFDVLNICSGKATSVNQVVHAIRTISGKKLLVNHGPPRSGDIRDSYGDPTKARKQIGFQSAISLSEGLSMLYAELQNQ